MIKIDTKGNKALSFILGLVYGYRNADIELKILPISSFSQENHVKDKCYFVNRETAQVYEKSEGCQYTHVCAIREDTKNKKVYLFIYRQI